MATSFLTPNMNLVVPVVGQELGPNWANDLNSSLGIVDGHNHSPGSGVQINPDGININANLSMNGNILTNAATVQFNIQSPQPTTLNTVYSYGTNGELFWNDNAGNQVQITTGGAINATSSGIVSGSASASFVSSVLVVSQSTGVGAAIDAATYILRYNGSYPTPTGNYITLAAPSSLSGGYQVTLPATPPGSQAILEMNSSGTISAVVADFQALTPPGVVVAFAGTSPPAGWLFCYGQTLNITSFPNLFAAIGDVFGGDGVTTFQLPNAQGVFIRSAGNQVIGGVTHSATFATTNSDTFQGHKHSISTSGDYVSVTEPVGAGGGATGIAALNAPATATGLPLDDGSDGTPRYGSETTPANICLNYIIKY